MTQPDFRDREALREAFFEGFVLGAALMGNYPTKKWREWMNDALRALDLGGNNAGF